MRFAKFIAVAAFAVASAASTADAREPTADELGQLRSVAAALDREWDAGNAAGLADLFTTDSSFVIFPEEPAHGKAALQAYFNAFFTQRQGKLRHIWSLDGADMLTPTTALVDGRVRIEAQMPDGSWRLVRYFVNHSIAVNEGRTWRLAHLRAHVMPNADAPPSS